MSKEQLGPDDVDEERLAISEIFFNFQQRYKGTDLEIHVNQMINDLYEENEDGMSTREGVQLRLDNMIQRLVEEKEESLKRPDCVLFSKGPLDGSGKVVIHSTSFKNGVPIETAIHGIVYPYGPFRHD